MSKEAKLLYVYTVPLYFCYFTTKSFFLVIYTRDGCVGFGRLSLEGVSAFQETLSFYLSDSCSGFMSPALSGK